MSINSKKLFQGETPDHARVGENIVQGILSTSLLSEKMNPKSHVKHTIIFDLFIFCYSKLHTFVDENGIYSSTKYIPIDKNTLKKELNINNYRTEKFLMILEELKKKYFKLNIRYMNENGYEAILPESIFSFSLIINEDNNVEGIKLFLNSALVDAINSSKDLRDRLESPDRYINFFMSNLFRLNRSNTKSRVFYQYLQKNVKFGILNCRITTLKKELGYSKGTNRKFFLEQIDSFIKELQSEKIYIISDFKLKKSKETRKYEDIVYFKYKPFIDINSKTEDIIQTYRKNIYINKKLNKNIKNILNEILAYTLSRKPDEATVALLKKFKNGYKNQSSVLYKDLIYYITSNFEIKQEELELILEKFFKVTPKGSNLAPVAFQETSKTTTLVENTEGVYIENEVLGVNKKINNLEKYEEIEKLVRVLFPNIMSVDEEGLKSFKKKFVDKLEGMTIDIDVSFIKEIMSGRKIESILNDLNEEKSKKDLNKYDVQFFLLHKELKEKNILKDKETFLSLLEYMPNLISRELTQEEVANIIKFEFKEEA